MNALAFERIYTWWEGGEIVGVGGDTDRWRWTASIDWNFRKRITEVADSTSVDSIKQ